ncbi:MAG: HNH endonuclease family protein [Vibrio ordalii]|uniref:HNH endonuclease family protein n=1 Tax=Vibrio ordalii TaxID=28174 RepID=UPI003F2B6AC1
MKLAKHSQEFNVEHILPKKLATDKRPDEWLWAKNEPEKHKQMVNRLGNLCLLEGDINRDVSNFDWNAKRFSEYPEKLAKRKDGSIKKSFKDSELPMVKEIIENDSYLLWSFDVIEQRQRHLAEYAAEIWRI